jgi:hypothetical protein
VDIRYRPTNWISYFAIVCLVGVLLSTTVQATHFCGFRGTDAQAAFELDTASSASPVCLTCLMAPSISALILLVAFFVMARSAAFFGGLQICPRPILDSFHLYIRPPPLDLN